MAWSAPRTWVAGETLTAALLNAELRDNLNAAEPVGSLHYYIRAATTVETLINAFALEGNGVAPLRATYGALNTLLSGLGYPFGSGNGSTTFTLPDVQARSLVGMASGGHADADSLGDSDLLGKTSRSNKHNTSLSLSGGTLTGSPSVSDPGHFHNTLQAGVGSVQSGSGPFNAVALNSNSVQSDTKQTGITVGVGTLAVSGLSGSAGPGGTRPTDLTPYLVAGVWAVKI